MAEPPDADTVDDGLARNGSLSYVQIPALDVERSAAFYAKVFGWTIQPRPGHMSFEDGTGHVVGAFIPGREISRAPGILPYIYVDRIDDTIEKVQAESCEIVRPPYPEGALKVATIRDPAGNVIGIWQDGTR